MTPLTNRVLMVSPLRSFSISFSTALVTCLFSGLNKHSLHVIRASWNMCKQWEQAETHTSTPSVIRTGWNTNSTPSMWSEQAETQTSTPSMWSEQSETWTSIPSMWSEPAETWASNGSRLKHEPALPPCDQNRLKHEPALPPCDQNRLKHEPALPPCHRMWSEQAKINVNQHCIWKPFVQPVYKTPV